MIPLPRPKPAELAEAIRAALRGELDPIEKFGVTAKLVMEGRGQWASLVGFRIARGELALTVGVSEAEIALALAQLGIT
jgi:hypothetical protein